MSTWRGGRGGGYNPNHRKGGGHHPPGASSAPGGGGGNGPEGPPILPNPANNSLFIPKKQRHNTQQELVSRIASIMVQVGDKDLSTLEGSINGYPPFFFFF